MLNILSVVKYYLFEYQDKVNLSLTCNFLKNRSVEENLSFDQLNALAFLKMTEEHSAVVVMNPQSGKTLVVSLYLQYLVSKQKLAFVYSWYKKARYQRVLSKLDTEFRFLSRDCYTPLPDVVPDNFTLIVDIGGSATTPSKTSLQKFFSEIFEKTPDVRLILVRDAEQLRSIDMNCLTLSVEREFNYGIFCDSYPADDILPSEFKIFSSTPGEIFSFDKTKYIAKEEIAKRLLMFSKRTVVLFVTENNSVGRLASYCFQEDVRFLNLATFESRDMSGYDRFIVIPDKNGYKSALGHCTAYMRARICIDKIRRRKTFPGFKQFFVLVDSSYSEETNFALSLLAKREDQLLMRLNSGNCTLRLRSETPDLRKGISFAQLFHELYFKRRWIETNEPRFILKPGCYFRTYRQETSIHYDKKRKRPEVPEEKRKLQRLDPAVQERQTELLELLIYGPLCIRDQADIHLGVTHT